MNKRSILETAKNLDIRQNVCIQVIDQTTGQVVQEHVGHNSATNSLLYGIAYHLIGNFMPNEGMGLNPGYSMLSNYVPKYISLGTMGLFNQDQDAYGLPAGIGDTIPDSSDPEYQRLLRLVNEAKQALDDAEEAIANECPYWPATETCETCQVCSDRIAAEKQAVEDAQAAYDQAYQNFIDYNEEARFVEYMKHAPGYGADGYDLNQNNGRNYPGLGYAFTSYDVTAQYKAASSNHEADEVTYKGIVYRCKKDTLYPAGTFDPTYWTRLPDSKQPSLGTTVNLELIAPTFPRMEISYRDVVPEYASENPKTIDIVFSSMVSTGALAQFRPEGQDFIFITEAGLWSKKNWILGNENGLLAGYRIGPPNEKNWDMTDPENRQILKQNILRVGANQVVQVVWKIQLGSLQEFVKLSSSSTTPTDPQPVYHDNAWVVLQSRYFNEDMARIIYSRLYSAYPAGDSSLPDIPTKLRRSSVKRGCPIPQMYTKSNELLYLDFELAEDASYQTVWWWTESGAFTATSNQSIYYWWFHYYAYGSSFYYMDFSNWILYNAQLINGSYGLSIFPNRGVNNVTINLTNASFYGNSKLGFYSSGEPYKPAEIIGLETTHWFGIAATSVYAGEAINGIFLKADLMADNIVNWYENQAPMRIGSIYGSVNSTFQVYARNYVIGPSLSYMLYVYSHPYHYDHSTYTIHFENWDVSNCSQLRQLLSINNVHDDVTVTGFETWKGTSSLRDVEQLFLHVTHYKGDLSSWDMSNVTNFSNMFEQTHWDHNTISTIRSWDVSSGMNFSYMFHGDSYYGPLQYKDYTFLNDWNVNPNANFDQILPYYQYVTHYPTWNGWFVDNGTFEPYTIGQVSRVTFRGRVTTPTDLPRVAQEGDAYYVVSASPHKYYYKQGQWLTV